MPIFMRFEENKHVETTTLQKKPEGEGWTKAPAEFEWGKAYCLTDGKVTESSAETLLDYALTTAKVQALQTLRTMIDAKRKDYVGYSPEKSQGYAVKADVADKIITQGADAVYVSLIEPLAKLRGIDVLDMAKLIQGKAQDAAKALLRCEFLEDQAKQTINEAQSMEAIQTILNNFEVNS